MNSTILGAKMVLLARALQDYCRLINKGRCFRYGQGAILHALKNGPLPQKELAPLLRLTPATVTVTLGRLEEREMIRRRKAANGRSWTVEATPKGLHWVAQNQKVWQKACSSMTDGLNEQELAAAGDLVSRLLTNLDKSLEAKP